MSGGVPIPALCCPTCGDHYALPLEVQRDEPDEVYTFEGPRWISPSRPPYIVCPSGHKWTLKTLFRADDQPDALLLGQYIGGP